MKLNNLKYLRSKSGVSQAQIASESGLSLATIQSIEQGHANPSLSTLTQLLTPLGYKLEITAELPDYEMLIQCGMPFEIKKKFKRQFSSSELLVELRKACLAIDPKRQDRFSEALSVFIYTIHREYPAFAKKNLKGSIFTAHRPDQLTGRMLKLSRITKARISKIL